MIKIRHSQERGAANFGWLDTRYTFSFSNYFDPKHMGFRSLRVINEDKVNSGAGFPTHGHKDMEIITYVIEGALEHKDSIGNGSIIRPGEVQRMSAGTGILHSEFNPSEKESVHLLQIWILPEKTSLKPSYEQKNFTEAEKSGQLRLIGSQDGRNNSVTIHQDVNLYAASLQRDETVNYQTTLDRGVWIQIVKGAITLQQFSNELTSKYASLSPLNPPKLGDYNLSSPPILGVRGAKTAVNNQILYAGDGAAITEETNLALTGNANQSEILLFDLV